MGKFITESYSDKRIKRTKGKKMKENLYFTEVVIPGIILILIIFGFFFYLDQKNLQKQFNIIYTNQEQILILLSKDYPEQEMIYKNKKPEPKMEK